MDGWCLRCKTKRLMVQTTETRQLNGVVIVKGKCDVCRGNMSTFITVVKGGKKP